MVKSARKKVRKPMQPRKTTKTKTGTAEKIECLLELRELQGLLLLNG